MDNNEEQPCESDDPEILRGPSASDVGPTGHTRREEQRRRLIITGMATPALMTLPSRRVWAANCTKSKLLSGDLSVNKKTGAGSLDCGPLGCGRTNWKDKVASPLFGEYWSSASFDSNMMEPGVFPGGTTMISVLNGATPVNNYGDNGVRDKVKGCAKEAAAAFLNATYVKWPAHPQFNFSLTQADVRSKWREALSIALSAQSVTNRKSQIDVVTNYLEGKNETGTTCPFI